MNGGGPSGVPRRPVVVELVGPAGSGKSTVFQELVSRRGDVRTVPVLSDRRYAGLLAANLLRVLALLVRRRALRGRTREQVVMMGYLQALPRVLDRHVPDDGKLVVFDQGPAYFLTRPVVRDPRLRAWRRQMLGVWSSRLAAVVFLDAPPEVLAGRINERDKPHALKGRPGEEAQAAIGASRAGLEQTISELAEQGRTPSLLSFDTSRVSVQEIVDEIVASLRPA